MSQTAVDANTITTQPLMSSQDITKQNEALGNTPNMTENVITTQPLMSEPDDEEQEKKKHSQFNPAMENPPENVKQQQNNTWCCYVYDPGCDCSCFDCDNCCDDCCDGNNDNNDCCAGCCTDNNDCCTGCCEGDASGGDVADCLECCTACFECCSSCDS